MRSSGGIGGFVYTEANFGYSQSIEFKTNNQELYYKNNLLQSQQPFALVKGKSIFSTDSLYYIKYSTESLLRQTITKLNRDSLILSDEAYDGFNTLYTR